LIAQVNHQPHLLSPEIYDTAHIRLPKSYTQWAKSPKKQSVKSVFLTIWHCVLKQKTHSFRLLFWRFCPLGLLIRWVDSGRDRT